MWLGFFPQSSGPPSGKGKCSKHWHTPVIALRPTPCPSPPPDAAAGAALRWYKAQQHLPEGVAPQPGEAVFQPVWQCYQVGIKKLLRDLETLPTDDRMSPPPPRPH